MVEHGGVAVADLQVKKKVEDGGVVAEEDGGVVAREDAEVVWSPEKTPISNGRARKFIQEEPRNKC